MSATACTLAVVLMFEAAASPLTEECPLTDNRCKAGLYERRAKTAPNPAQRALYLFGAYRSYLLLFEKTANLVDLCAARRALDASLAVSGQPPGQREVSRTMRAELVTRQREADADCRSVAGRSPIKKTNAPLIASRPAPTPPPEPAPAPSDHEPPVTAAESAQTTTTTPPARTALLADPDSGPPTVHPEPAPDLMPVSARRVNTERLATAPRPGRGLVLAGGVTLGVGVALTAAAGFMGRRTADTRREVLTLHDMLDGYATEDQAAAGDALTRDHNALRSQTVALAMAGGATLVIAVVLASVGGRRMARAASRTALVPAPGGLAFHARF